MKTKPMHTSNVDGNTIFAIAATVIGMFFNVFILPQILIVAATFGLIGVSLLFV